MAKDIDPDFSFDFGASEAPVQAAWEFEGLLRPGLLNDKSCTMLCCATAEMGFTYFENISQAFQEASCIEFSTDLVAKLSCGTLL